MISLHDILFGLVLPACIALIVITIAWRPWSKGSPRGQWAGGLAIGGSFFAGMLGLQPMPAMPPVAVEDWLVFAGIAVAVLGVIDGLIRLPKIVRIVIAVAVSGAIVYLVLIPLTRGSRFTPAQWSGKEAATWITVITIAMTLGFLVLERATQKLHDATVPLLMTMAAGTLGLYMMFSNSQSFGQRAGVIAAATGAIFAIAIWSKKVSLARGGVLAFVVLFGGLLATCYALVPNPVTYRLVLIGISPLVGLLPSVLPMRDWKRWIICAIFAAIPLGIALIPAAIQFAHEYNAPKESYSE